MDGYMDFLHGELVHVEQSRAGKSKYSDYARVTKSENSINARYGYYNRFSTDKISSTDTVDTRTSTFKRISDLTTLSTHLNQSLPHPISPLPLRLIKSREIHFLNPLPNPML